MVDEGRDEPGTALDIAKNPYFPGMRRYLRKFWRGGRLPPRYDGTHSPIEYQPRFRVVEWVGLPVELAGHVCGNPPHCSVPGGRGRHSEVRPDGMDWGEVHFSCLEEALANQAFREWYEERGGKAVVDKGLMTFHEPYYDKEGQPPPPLYNFFLIEHVDEMSAQEIRAYQTTGFIPKRLRRRGSAKPGSPPQRS